MQRRNWKEYNEKLVRRGEAYISLDFLESRDEEIRKMNKGKVGRLISIHKPSCISWHFSILLFYLTDS